MLEFQIARLKRCQRMDKLVVATSVNYEDQPIVDLCENLNVGCFRGDLNNVLDRFYQAARLYNANHVIRLTGDCPLADPAIIDKVIYFYLNQDCDYASNCRPPTLPDGLEVEIFSFSSLERSWKEASTPFELEHVTPYMVYHPSAIRMVNYTDPRKLSHLRWTVDEPEDFELVSIIFESIYRQNPFFDTDDLMQLYDIEPQLIQINSHLKVKYDKLYHQ